MPWASEGEHGDPTECSCELELHGTPPECASGGIRPLEVLAREIASSGEEPSSLSSRILYGLDEASR
jgi:hypothetical protein